MSSTIIVFVIVTLVLIVIMALNKMKKAPMVENHPSILELTDQNFTNAIKDKVVLVDFWAAWCMPCKMMAPILNDLSNELDGNKAVGKVDIEKYQNLAQKFGIRSIPTLVLFKNGKEVERFVGIKQKGFLKGKMEKY